MVISANSTIHFIPPPISIHRRPLLSGAICCSRIEDRDGGELSLTYSEEQQKHKDIWMLFKEAQQNILYLNKQRLSVIEELRKAKKEKQKLLSRIEDLEKAKLASRSTDNTSSQWELLFRIDYLVLSGTISTAEANDWRRLVVDNRFGVPDALTAALQKTDTELLTVLRQISWKSQRSCFHVIQICTEMEPMISVGSLGSYVTGLSRALQRHGNLVEVILPKYTTLNLSEVEGLQETKSEFYSYFDGQMHGNRIWTGVISGIGVTFIQPVHYSSFFNRETIYGYPDDFERFMYFSRASLDYIIKSGKHPDILHIHNWETAIVGPLFWDVFVNLGLEATRILLTCQGFESQHLEQPEKLALCGLDPARLNRSDRLQDNARTHLVNILKGGIVYSNKVVVMSLMHSKEQIIRNLGHELEPTLALHKDKVLVSPYGLEYSSWDPSTDKVLPKSYSRDEMAGKAVCKAALQEHVGLPEHSSTVLVGCIFSQVSDMDIENFLGVIQIASRRGAQFIIVGDSSKPSGIRALHSIQDEMQQVENMRLIDQYDEALLHLILGGSDIILCQSYEDPPLQIPLKAMRYGAAPITLSCKGSHSRYVEEGDFGSTRFSRYVDSVFGHLTLLQALDEIKHNPTQWKAKIADAMSMDFSWDAECYDTHITAYESIKNL